MRCPTGVESPTIGYSPPTWTRRLRNIASTAAATRTCQSRRFCNGRGSCEPFANTGLSFCRCESGYGGLECEHRRLSQMKAWILCLFLGPTGADQYYLGWYLEMLATQIVSLLAHDLAAGHAELQASGSGAAARALDAACGDHRLRACAGRRGSHQRGSAEMRLRSLLHPAASRDLGDFPKLFD